jgi:hypothetical protein
VSSEAPPALGRKTGTFRVERPEPWLFYGTISGHYAESMAAPYLTEMARALGHTKPMVGFHDWSEMTSYDTACRLRMTDWVMRNRAQQAKHHILLRSKLVSMGVATASLILGGDVLVAYTDPARFREVLRAVRR